MERAVPIQVKNVTDILLIWGVHDVYLFEDLTKAERITTEVFDGDFESCMDKTLAEIDDYFKSSPTLTIRNGQIIPTPGIKINIKSFIQWSKDVISTGRYPTITAFPIDKAIELIRKSKVYKAFFDKSKTIIDTAKPTQFTEKKKWEDWNSIFLNLKKWCPN